MPRRRLVELLFNGKDVHGNFDAVLSYDLVSGVVVLLLSFSVLFVRSTTTSKNAASDEITPITVPLITPRRPLIPTLLSLAALAYAAYAAVAIVRAILSGVLG